MLFTTIDFITQKIVPGGYLLLTFILFWGYIGYFLLLFFSRKQNPANSNNTEKIQQVAVLIPCYNEEELVEAKVQNLEALDSKDLQVQFYFLNGLSTDHTSARISQAIRGKSNWHLIDTEVKGKIQQLNIGLNRVAATSQIIVNTDMDAILTSDVLQKMVAAFESNPRIAVAGALVEPGASMVIERSFWQEQNMIRILESNAYTSSTVVAPCYAFRKNLLQAFPKDCIADDVYVSFLANSNNLLTRYLPGARGRELRSPLRWKEYIKHKYRKGNANYVETFRFFRLWRLMPPRWKLIFINRAAQLMLFPWVFLLYSLLSCYLVMNVGQYGILLLFSISLLFSGLLLLSRVWKQLRYWDKTGEIAWWRKNSLLLFSVILSNSILVAISLSYYFYRQDSSYAKVSSCEN